MRLFGITMVVMMAAVTARAAAAQEPTADTAAQASVARAPRQSWTSDRRSFGVGDVITVLIDEQTLASASTGNFASDRRRRDLSAAANQVAGGTAARVAATIGSSNDAESRQRGEAVRQNRFVGEMTVRVVAVENGLLQIRGERSTQVDRSTQEMSLTGWVRPQDVTADNLLESWRIGDAELVYSSTGDLGKPRGGLLTRLLSAIWP